MTEISELKLINDIEDLSNEFKLKYGIAPFNLSDWNPSEEFNTYMKSKVMYYGTNINAANYAFSYSIEPSIVNDLQMKLCGEQINSGSLITHSGSSSIYNVINWLHKCGCEKLAVICPVYFTVEYACKNFNIEFNKFFLERNSERFFVSDSIKQEIELYNYVWVTNPIYCTSMYYDDSLLAFFRRLLDKGKILIFDESLCEPGKEIVRRLGTSENVIGIYAPHKSICFNGIKFSMIIFDKKYQNFYEQWADILNGCLSVSNIKAINNYLSKSYTNYHLYLKQKNNDTIEFIEQLCNKYDVQYDKSASGYLISLYFPNILAEAGLDLTFIRKIIYECEVSLIPGIRNHFNNTYGFAFRINLCADNDRFRISLERLIRFLKNM